MKKPTKTDAPKKGSIGSRLRQERRDHKLTQEQMAQILGISPSYLGAIERGQRPVSRMVMDSIHRRFGISYDYLLEGHKFTSASIVQYVRDSGKYTTHHNLNVLLSISTPEEQEACYNLIYTFLVQSRKCNGGLSNLPKPEKPSKSASKRTSAPASTKKSESSSL